MRKAGKHGAKFSKNEKAKEKRELMKSMGLCIRCGEKALDNKTYCKNCKEYMYQRRRKIQSEK